MSDTEDRARLVAALNAYAAGEPNWAWQILNRWDDLTDKNTRYRAALIRLREPGLSEAWVAEIIRVALEGTPS